MDLLDPKRDIVFKLLFARPGNEDLLGSMIQAVLRLPTPIESLSVLNPGLIGDVADGKTVVLDLCVRLADGTQLDVEMETQPRPVVASRFVYYWARLHASQLDRGEDYQDLRPTIGIVWLNGLIPAVGGRFHSAFRVREIHTGVPLTEQLELHLLALPNLACGGPTHPSLARWARFFLARDLRSLQDLAVEDPVMSKASAELQWLSADPMTKEMLEGIKRQELWRRHELAVERKEGRAEGLEEGMEKGREEARRGVARSMLGQGLPLELIARVTGLTEEVVRFLEIE